MNKNKNIQLICNALGLSELDYTTMVFDAGYAWMHFYFLDDATIIGTTAKCGMFWNWWRNQWEIRDAAYLRYAPIEELDLPLEGITKAMALELYNEYHEPTQINVRPNKIVTTAIGKLLRTEIKKEKQNIKVMKNV